MRAGPPPISETSLRTVHRSTEIPSLAAGTAMNASGSMTRRSEASASCTPAPSAPPLIAEITGTGADSMVWSMSSRPDRNASE